jgi:putative salt-induced outer membrane protein YdiY
MLDVRFRPKLFCSSLVALLLLPATAQAEDPAPEPLWKRSLGLSLLATDGNSETFSFGLDGQIKRRPEPWGFLAYATALRVENRQESDPDKKVPTERLLVGFGTERALNAKSSLFGRFDIEKNEPAGLDLRTVTALGYKHQALKDPIRELAFELGLTYTTEDAVFELPGVDDSFVGAILGLDYLWNIREGTSFSEQLRFYPNFDESDDWRATSKLALRSALSKRSALEFGFEVRYDNLPFAGADDTDLSTTVSLVLGDPR